MFFPHFVAGLMRAGFAEARDYRRDFLAVWCVWVDVVKDINERDKLGELFLQLIELLR